MHSSFNHLIVASQEAFPQEWPRARPTSLSSPGFSLSRVPLLLYPSPLRLPCQSHVHHLLHPTQVRSLHPTPLHFPCQFPVHPLSNSCLSSLSNSCSSLSSVQTNNSFSFQFTKKNPAPAGDDGRISPAWKAEM